MKKILITIAAAWAFALTAMAQTPEEIINGMEAATNRAETEGLSMAMDIKIPILGTQTSTTYILGDKVKTEMTLMKTQYIMYEDETTEWEYDSSKNKITIKSFEKGTSKSSEAEENLSLFDGITQEYDVKLDKETADAWYIRCDKKKTCTEKDAPKRMDLVIAKKDYMPISLSTTISGVKMTIRDVKLGVKEEDVTFNINDFPGAVIEDQRLK